MGVANNSRGSVTSWVVNLGGNHPAGGGATHVCGGVDAIAGENHLNL